MRANKDFFNRLRNELKREKLLDHELSESQKEQNAFLFYDRTCIPFSIEPESEELKVVTIEELNRLKAENKELRDQLAIFRDNSIPLNCIVDHMMNNVGSQNEFYTILRLLQCTVSEEQMYELIKLKYEPKPINYTQHNTNCIVGDGTQIINKQ